MQVKTVQALEAINPQASQRAEEKEKVTSLNSNTEYSCDLVAEQERQYYQEWLEVKESISINNEELLSDGHYSLTDEQTLETLAKTFDTKALYVLGINAVWESNLGVKYFGDNGMFAPGKDLGNIKSHKPNRELQKKGNKLLYQAALRGRYGAIQEMKIGYSMLINRKMNHNTFDLNLLAELESYMALDMLAEQILGDDAPLLKSSVDDEWLEQVTRFAHPEFSNVELSEKLDALMISAKKQTKSMLLAWSKDRATLGLWAKPQVVPEHLKVFAKQWEAHCEFYEVLKDS